MKRIVFRCDCGDEHSWIAKEDDYLPDGGGWKRVRNGEWGGVWVICWKCDKLGHDMMLFSEDVVCEDIDPADEG